MNEEGKMTMDKLASALVKAQAAFPEIPRTAKVSVRTKVGVSYEFKYAPFETIIAAVRKPLADNGLALIQSIETNFGSGDKSNARIQTIIVHESGQKFVSGGTPIINDGVGPQAYGSAITYAKRYDLSLTLGIATNDDDDGAGASGNTTTAKKLAAAGGNQDGAEAVGVDEVFYALLQVAARKGVESLRDVWEGATPKQRKGLKPRLEDLKVVAHEYDVANTANE